MKIKRLVSGVTYNDGCSDTVYSLNGFRVWVDDDKLNTHVGTFLRGAYRLFMDDIRDPELAALAYALAHNDSGQLKIDPTNENIKNFLIVTKCI